jgi:hypothetical protein
LALNLAAMKVLENKNQLVTFEFDAGGDLSVDLQAVLAVVNS